jgi:hypothetical protein
VGTTGGSTVVYGRDSVHVSADGATWTTLDSPFDGFDITGSATRADGALVASGLLFDPSGVSAATFLGQPS